MTIEYIELKEGQSNPFWNDINPPMYLDDSLCKPLSPKLLSSYGKVVKEIQKHDRYSLLSLNKKNLVLEFVPFASRALRRHLDASSTADNRVPLITTTRGLYYVYIVHDGIHALLKISQEEVGNEFLDILDRLYNVTTEDESSQQTPERQLATA